MKIKASQLDMMEALKLTISRKNNYYIEKYVERIKDTEPIWPGKVMYQEDIEMGGPKREGIEYMNNCHNYVNNLQNALGQPLGQQGQQGLMGLLGNAGAGLGNGQFTQYSQQIESNPGPNSPNVINYPGLRKAIETIKRDDERTRTPNIHWLDDRINEVRVKLC